MEEKERLEQQVSETLTEGEMEAEHPQTAARERLMPKYEIRIQASVDPIVEETHKFRAIAEEIDDRYGRYMRRAERQEPDE